MTRLVVRSQPAGGGQWSAYLSDRGGVYSSHLVDAPDQAVDELLKMVER